MTWLSLLFPQTILRTSSPYNRDIRINEERGRFKLLVNGARESGENIEGLWKFAFGRLSISKHVKSILVLGVAGGTVIHLFHEMFPQASIVGVDIDPVMIDIGKKYFGLGDIPELRLIAQDALEFVNRDGHYDLVVVDLFIGPEVPDFVISTAFEQKVRRLCGLLLINYLRQPGYEEKVKKLEGLLKKLYAQVVTVDRYNNRFFYCKIG